MRDFGKLPTIGISLKFTLQVAEVQLSGQPYVIK